MASSEVLLRPPEIPSKWDIIPIHSSDVASYKQCRRRWDWSSPTRNNLRRKVEIYGVNFPLWFGTGIHFALERFYDPMLSHDPVESFKTWFQYQWEGGLVDESWLEHTYDVSPRIVEGTFKVLDTFDGKKATHKTVNRLYQIRGLQELIPDPYPEEFEAHYELGIGMMEFYKSYAKRVDDFVVVAAESVYSIPLGFEVKDIREDSPNYGKKLEVHARGKRDAITFYPETGKYGLIDHKTAARIDESYFAKLDKDEQCSNYLWATMQEALLYDLPWQGKVVDRIIYNAIRKSFPKPPTPLKNGYPSLNKANEGTTAELFMEYIRDNDLEFWFHEDEKAQAYYNYLVQQGDSLFVQRDVVTRNKYEVEATGKHLRMIAEEMTSDPAIYPNPTGNFGCIHCAFRSPCIAADDGSDWMGMLADSYEENRDR